jgi:serine/threonine-protein kinase TTK/MPS1
MDLEPQSNLSTYSTLYRITQQKRGSPLLSRSQNGSPGSQHSREAGSPASRPTRGYGSPQSQPSRDSGSPSSQPPKDSGFPSRSYQIPFLDADDAYDSDDNENYPQLSSLARLLLEKKTEVAKEDNLGADEQKCSPLSRYASRKSVRWSGGKSPDSEGPSQSDPSPDGAQNSSAWTGGHEPATPAYSRYNSKGYYTGLSGSSGNSAETKKDVDARHTGTNSIIRPAPGTAGPLTMRRKRFGRGLLEGVAGAPRRGPRRESNDTRDGAQNDQNMDKAQDLHDHEKGESHPSENAQEYDHDKIVPKSWTISTNGVDDGEAVHVGGPVYAPIPSRKIPLDGHSDDRPGKMNVYRSPTLEKSGLPDVNDIRSSQRDEHKKPSISSDADIAAPAAPEPSYQQPDKENMPPPTFQRSSSYRILSSTEEKPPIFQAPLGLKKFDSQPHIDSALDHSPNKKVPLMKSFNNPVRPAPPPPPTKIPPPKMSIIQMATASAGASTTSSVQNARKSKSAVTINGKTYKRLGAIGKGGSCKVYRVMAENYKIFAMKKVTFSEQHGPDTIRGYKGEIDLLKNLANEERVISLFDYEMIDSKHTLTMVGNLFSHVYNSLQH